MIPDIYEVTNVGRGCLYVMPKPNPEQLDSDLKYFSHLGINVLVSHLEQGEASELGLEKELLVANTIGITFLSYPIRDRGLPENEKKYVAFIEDLYLQLIAGANVAIHCRAGIGRTGVSASCLLIRDGYDAQSAMDMVSAARRIQIPDTEAQYDFISDFNPLS